MNTVMRGLCQSGVLSAALVRKWKLVMIRRLARYQAACWEPAAVTVEELEVLWSLMGVNWVCMKEWEQWVAAEQTSLSDGKHSFQ